MFWTWIDGIRKLKHVQAAKDGLGLRLTPTLCLRSAVDTFSGALGADGAIGFQAPVPASVPASGAISLQVDLGPDWDQYKTLVLSVIVSGTAIVTPTSFSAPGATQRRVVQTTGTGVNGYSFGSFSPSNPMAVQLLPGGRFMQIAINNTSAAPITFDAQITAL